MTDDQQKPTLKNLHQQSLQFDLCRDSYQNKSDDARSKFIEELAKRSLEKDEKNPDLNKPPKRGFSPEVAATLTDDPKMVKVLTDGPTRENPLGAEFWFRRNFEKWDADRNGFLSQSEMNRAWLDNQTNYYDAVMLHALQTDGWVLGGFGNDEKYFDWSGPSKFDMARVQDISCGATPPEGMYSTFHFDFRGQLDNNSNYFFKGRSLRSIQMEQVAIGISKEYSATETVAKLKHFSAQDVKLMDEAFSKRYRKTTADFLRDKLQKHPKELSEALNALAKAGVDIYRLK